MRLFVLCFAAGVWYLQRQAELPVPQTYWLLAPALAAGLMPIVVSHAVARIARAAILAACCVVCGYGWAAWLATERMSDRLPPEWEGRDIQIIGIIAAMPLPYERSLRFEFDVETILTPDARIPARVALSWWGASARDSKVATLPELHAGERWRITVRMREPHGTLNAHGFDYEAWLLERNLRATGYVRAVPTNRRLTTQVVRPQYIVERLREAVRDRIQRALDGAPYAGVLAALAIGDQRSIPQSQWQIFTRTGVNHLMSISGLHVTMLAGLAFSGVYFLWRRSFQLTLSLPARKAATVAGFAVAVLYAWLSGFAVPAQRTVYMLAVIAVALWTGRIAASTVVLCWALFAVLVIDPWAVLAPGFWLSFGAVAVIMLVASGRITPPYWLVAWGRVQWAVTLGLVPLLLALFQQMSLVSPVANALAIPVVSLAVVPLTLLGVLLPIDLGLHAAHVLMSGCGMVLEWLSKLPVAVWQQQAPASWTVALALTGVFWLLLPRGFPVRYLGIVALLPLFIVKPAPLATGDLRLTVLDVGQGLAIVAQTRNHALLYDAGPAFGPQADSGNRIIVPFLRAAGVRALDGIVVSHADNDHSGGAASVMQAVPLDWMLSSLGDDHPLRASGTRAIRCEAGQRWRWDEIDFEVLHPPADHYDRAKSKTNDRSCVLRIGTRVAGILLSADIEQKSERELLVRAAEKLEARVMIVPHHGSRTSSSLDFVREVDPDIAIVSAGYRNRFGHPRADVLERYSAMGSQIYRTDRDGAVTLEFGDRGITVRPYRAEYRRYWLAAYDPREFVDEWAP